MTKDRYLVCPFCSSKKVDKENAADSLKECMKRTMDYMKDVWQQ